MNMDDQTKEWLRRHAEDSGKKILESGVMIGLVTKSFLKEPVCALQIGFAILMDKPIFLIVDQNEKVPLALAKIAKVIERVDVNNPADMERATRSLNAFMSTFKKGIA